MHHFVVDIKNKIDNLLEKINKENNELLYSDNYLDLKNRLTNINQINEEVSYFCQQFSNKYSIVFIRHDNIHISSNLFGNFSIIFKKTYIKDNLLYEYKIEGQSPIISTFLKYFSNFIYLNVSFFSLEKKYLSMHKPSYTSLKKEIDFIKESLIKTQDYEKIIDNILNGVSYVKFNIKKNNINTKLCIEMKNTHRNIPNFEKNSIYLPKIKNGTINDYFKTYKEFSSLIILDENKEENKEENKLKLINILESVKILKQNVLLTMSHNVNIKQIPSMKNFKEEYLTIINYVKENYIQKEPLGKNFFYLTYNFKNNIIYVNYTKNPAFSNLSISFDLGDSNYIKLNDSFFNYLLKNNNPSNYYEVDKDKIIGFQRTNENLKYF